MELIKTLIDSYAPSPVAIDIVRSTNIALLVGIAGAGKDTVKHQLLQGDDYCEIVSHTTRPPRANNGVMENDGQDYHFIDLATATEMVQRREFIEAKLVHGSVVYGTSIAAVDKARLASKTAVTDIDVQGVAEYMKLSSKVVAIFIIPPSFAIWRDRLARRYPTPQEFAREWPKRRDSAVRELEFALSMPYFQFVLNDDLTSTISDTHQIIQGSAASRNDNTARQVARQLVADIKASD